MRDGKSQILGELMIINPPSFLMMAFDGLLRQQLLNLFVCLQALHWRLYEAVEEESRVHEESETNNLQPLEALPAQPQRDDPDEEGSASVNCRSSRSTNVASDRETKEIESSIEEVLRLELALEVSGFQGFQHTRC
jgi:hypothetical protein